MINKVILVGNLGKDPEFRSLQNGNEVCNFSVATTESWKDKNTGERKSKTEWHNVVIFNAGFVKLAKYLKKGSKVYVEGQLQTRKWQDTQGNDKYTTEVVLQINARMQLLDSKQDSLQNQHSVDKGNAFVSEQFDDEIPF
jgi:single-strand DNA-binding protein